MLEEHEYVNLVVDVPPSGDRAGGGGPASSVDQRVTLNRVHLGTTPSQLLDAVLEERPELRASRDRLAMAFVDGARARGGRRAREPVRGRRRRQKTLRELGGDKRVSRVGGGEKRRVRRVRGVGTVRRVRGCRQRRRGGSSGCARERVSRVGGGEKPTGSGAWEPFASAGV